MLNDRAYALTGPANDHADLAALPTDASESTWAPTGINQLLAEPDAAKVVLLMISLSAARPASGHDRLVISFIIKA